MVVHVANREGTEGFHGGDDMISDYDAIKATILKRYGVNEEAYCQWPCGVQKSVDESHRELATCVREIM